MPTLRSSDSCRAITNGLTWLQRLHGKSICQGKWSADTQPSLWIIQMYNSMNLSGAFKLGKANWRMHWTSDPSEFVRFVHFATIHEGRWYVNTDLSCPSDNHFTKLETEKRCLPLGFRVLCHEFLDLHLQDPISTIPTKTFRALVFVSQMSCTMYM